MVTLGHSHPLLAYFAHASIEGSPESLLLSGAICTKIPCGGNIFLCN